jgi:hypothetical protein
VRVVDLLEYFALVLSVWRPSTLLMIVLLGFVFLRVVATRFCEAIDPIIAPLATSISSLCSRAWKGKGAMMMRWAPPPRPHAYQVGDCLEIFTEADNESTELALMVHPPVLRTLEATTIPTGSIVYLPLAHADRFPRATVRVAWSSVPFLGCYSRARTVPVRAPHLRLRPAICTVADSRDAPWSLRFSARLVVCEGEPSLMVLPRELLKHVHDFLDSGDAFHFALLTSKSISKSLAAPSVATAFVCRVEDELGYPILPLVRPLDEHMELQLLGTEFSAKQEEHPLPRVRVRLAALSSDGAASVWSEPVVVHLGLHHRMSKALGELRSHLRGSDRFSEQMVASIHVGQIVLRDFAAARIAMQQRCCLPSFALLESMVDDGIAQIVRQQQEALYSITSLRTALQWDLYDPLTHWNGVQTDRELGWVTKIDCSARGNWPEAEPKFSIDLHHVWATCGATLTELRLEGWPGHGECHVIWACSLLPRIMLVARA